jgi:hypothetical protein
VSCLSAGEALSDSVLTVFDFIASACLTAFGSYDHTAQSSTPGEKFNASIVTRSDLDHHASIEKATKKAPLSACFARLAAIRQMA